MFATADLRIAAAEALIPVPTEPQARRPMR